MSRNFTGMRSGGTKKHSSKELFIKKIRGEDDRNLSPEERYQKVLQEKIEKLRNEAKSGARFGVTLPGTEASENTRKISKSAQEVIDKLAEKRAKKMAKKMQSRSIKVTPKYLSGMQGGRIDASGKIWGPDGRLIASIDTKTGKVKAQNGNTICKYTNSSYCEYTIAQYVAKQYPQQSSAGVHGSSSGSGAGGGVWGSGWGSGGGSDSNSDWFWGN